MVSSYDRSLRDSHSSKSRIRASTVPVTLVSLSSPADGRATAEGAAHPGARRRVKIDAMPDTPRLVRRYLLASYLVFVTGMAISGVIFYRGRPLEAKAAILSDLESPDDNPRGYAASAVGTALSAILLAPAVAGFYQRLRTGRPALALAGAVLFAAGLAAAVAIGILAPFTHGYTPLHVQLASAAFIGIFSGTLLHLLTARAAPGWLAFQFFALLALVYLCYGPVEFDNSRFLTGLAFWEWLLCADCAVALWVLAGKIQAVPRRGVTRTPPQAAG